MRYDRKVHGQLRTPKEGIESGFTKPNSKRHIMNPGGGVHVCAGISNCRVVLWEYFTGSWSGEKAADMYTGPIKAALKKHRGAKAYHLIAEDNDPTGYKSKAGIRAKEEQGIRAMPWPRYSPDLNPLDFSLWDNVNRRMDASAPAGRESVAAFKKRLRLTALRTPPAVVRKMVEAMKKKAQMIWEAGGGDIRKD